jgi:menaquinol-cytochrome c reductase iron-sulfur subunit
MSQVVDSPLPGANAEPSPRRTFLVRLAAGVIGVIVALFPFAAGLGVLFDPLRRKQAAAEGAGPTLLRVGPLDLLPADGVPHQFALSADVVDAWTRAAAQRVGTVFLTRETSDGEPKVTALSSVCPHLGCAVDFISKDGQFECPCHASAFAKDGIKLFGPSLRGLDPLEVQILDSGEGPEIWVAYERFRTGLAERVAIG